MFKSLVVMFTLLGGQPFAGMTLDDGVMHEDCVELHVVVCADGFIY